MSTQYSTPYSFSNIKEKTTEELIRIYALPTEYQPKYIEEVYQELAYVRNYDLNKLKIEVDEIREKNTEQKDIEIAKGEDLSAWAIFGYIALAGFLIPSYKLFHRKIRNSKGELFYKYCETARNLGKALFYSAIFEWVNFLLLLLTILIP